MICLPLRFTSSSSRSRPRKERVTCGRVADHIWSVWLPPIALSSKHPKGDLNCTCAQEISSTAQSCSNLQSLHYVEYKSHQNIKMKLGRRNSCITPRGRSLTSSYYLCQMGVYLRLLLVSPAFKMMITTVFPQHRSRLIYSLRLYELM